MAEVKTPHFEIFNYWKDKIIEENGNVTTNISSAGIDVVTDWGEPCCWGCGKPIIGSYEESLSSTENIDFSKLWNDKKVKSKLNRCHIVPGALGGEDAPHNLFLLCGGCHITSPDTKNARSFYRWVFSQRKKHVCGELHPLYMIEEASKELERRNLLPAGELLYDAVAISNGKIFTNAKEFLNKHMGSHGSAIVESSRICTLADYVQKIYLDACLESAEQHGTIS